MKITAVQFNNKRKDFEVALGSRRLRFPFLKAAPRPTAANPVARVYVDKDFGGDAFTYVLADGAEGTVHGDHILEYNEDPAFLADLFIYRLTLEVKKRVEASSMAKREIVRRLRTSPTQLYRLLDQDRTAKSLPQLLMILHSLDFDIDLVIRKGRNCNVIVWKSQLKHRDHAEPVARVGRGFHDRHASRLLSSRHGAGFQSSEKVQR